MRKQRKNFKLFTIEQINKLSKAIQIINDAQLDIADYLINEPNPQNEEDYLHYWTLNRAKKFLEINDINSAYLLLTDLKVSVNDMDTED